MNCYKNAELRRSSPRKTELVAKIKLQEKVKEAKEIINNSFNLLNRDGDKVNYPVIAFSGGKDSLIVLDLVRQIRPDIEAVFCNTGNEYKETVPYARSFENVTELHPEKSFMQCFKEYGLPQMKSKAKSHGNQCCNWLKEKPATEYYLNVGVDLVFTGLTSDESRNRMMFLKRMGHTYFYKRDKYNKCHPIYNWSEEEVWLYIKMNKLAYNPIYDMGIPRCGCRYCTAYLSWKEVTALYDLNDPQVLMKLQGQNTLSQFS